MEQSKSSKNRHIISRIIDCIKFCGGLQLILQGHQETEDSVNPGVFLGLIDFVAIRTAVKEHTETKSIFKVASKTIQIGLYDQGLSLRNGNWNK